MSKNVNKTKIFVHFNEASKRENIESGESVNTLFGKIKKIISDLHPSAFTGTAYDDTEIKSAISNKVDKIEGSSLISASDLAQISINKDDILALKGDGAGSIDAMISAKIDAWAAQLTDDGTVNTYAEAIQWIADHGSEYTELLGSVVNKVDKVSGKGLSTNDLTSALKSNYDAAYTHSQSDHAPSNAQANVIESVKVNGTALTPNSKAVDITLENIGAAPKSHHHDDRYYTESEINTKLNAKAECVRLSGDIDFNTITTPGFYNYSDSSATITNGPSINGATPNYFGLEVIHTAAGSYYVQILYFNRKSYRRSCCKNSSGVSEWSDWTEELFTYGEATTTKSGLMSADDKKKLDNAQFNGKLSVTGSSSYNISNTVEYPLIGFDLYGKSVQNGVPTPTNPVEIISAGDKGFDIITKDETHFNILSVRDTGSGIITKQPCSIAKQNGDRPKISIGTNDTGLTYQWQYLSSTVTDWTNSNSEGAKTDTLIPIIGDEWNNVKIRCIVTDSNGNIEISNESTVYVVSNDCEVKTASIVLDDISFFGIPVSSGGNYTDSTGQQWICDTLICNTDGTGKIVKRAGKYTFTGSEAFALRNNDNGRCVYALANFLQYKFYSESRIISDKFVCTDTVVSGAAAINSLKIGETCLFFNNASQDNAIYFGSSCATLENFKSEITGSTIIYPLSEPYEIELSAAEMMALMQLQTYDGNTSISNNSGATMDISYCANKNISETVNPVYQNLYQNLNGISSSMQSWGTKNPGALSSKWCKVASVTIDKAGGEYHAILSVVEYQNNSGSLLLSWDCSTAGTSVTTIGSQLLIYLGGAGTLATSYTSTFASYAVVNSDSITFTLWCIPRVANDTFKFKIINDMSINGDFPLTKYDKPDYETALITGTRVNIGTPYWIGNSNISNYASYAYRMRGAKVPNPGTDLDRYCKIATVTLGAAWGDKHVVFIASESEIGQGTFIFSWDCETGSTATALLKNSLSYIAGTEKTANISSAFFTEAIVGSSSITFNLWFKPIQNYQAYTFSVIHEAGATATLATVNYSPAYTTTAPTGSISYLSNAEWPGNAKTATNADTVDGKHASDFATSSHTHSDATTTNSGLMSATDKKKLDGIASNYLPITGGTVTGAVTLKPASGEGGQIELDASSANTSQNGIILDQYNGNLRIFGRASADGTTVTGTGTTLWINPYTKTILGGYTFDGTANYASVLSANIVKSIGNAKQNKFYYIGSFTSTATGWDAYVSKIAFYDGVGYTNSGEIIITARHDGSNNKWTRARILVQSMYLDYKSKFHLIEVSSTELQLWVQISSGDYWTPVLHYIYGNKLKLSSTPTAVYDSLPEGTDHVGECTFYGDLAGNANTVNHHTVESDVPANAKFTDTWRGVVDNLTSTDTTKSLSANQGKVLKGLVDGKASSSHTHSSYVNQNAFSNVVVGSTTIAADTATDTLTLVGSNVTLTPDATNDKVTIGITKANVTAALGYTPPTTNTTYSSKAAASGGTDVSLVTTGEKYNWNAKASTAVATTSANGLMSASDKKALDILKNPSATCTTARSDLNKVVSLDNFVLTIGTIITIKFTDTGTSNPASGTITLNVNGTGAKEVVYISNGNFYYITYGMGWMFYNNRTYTFKYNGVSWECMDVNMNTTYSNFVKSGSGAKSGLVPAPPTTAGTTKYLREDGTWATPPNASSDDKLPLTGGNVTGNVRQSGATTDYTAYKFRNIGFGTTSTPTSDTTYGGSGSIYFVYS